MKRTWLKRYTKLTAKKPMRKVRSKPRANRLKGADMEALRRACFERDNYRCQECRRPLTWESGQLAHIQAKRRHGDRLDNVRCLCFYCHHAEHNPKPVPAKGKEC